MGEARSFLNAILFRSTLRAVFVVVNLFSNIVSALKALIILSPESVSSNIDIMVPNSSCDSVDCFLSERLSLPIKKPVTGNNTSSTNERSGLITIKKAKIIRMVSGSRITPSSVPMMLHSISFTSLLMRLIISPFF